MTTEDPRGILRRFLECPLSRRRFIPFYELCYRRILGFLRHLDRNNWILPVDEVAERDPLIDLTIDILGPFFRQDSDRSFPLIFDYFKGKGFEPFSEADIDDLYDAFLTLIFGFARRELKVLRRKAQPQSEKLKKQFKLELKKEEYSETESHSWKLVCLETRKRELAERQLRLMPYEELLDLVEAAYLQTTNANYVSWCRRVFAMLDEQDSHSRAVRLDQLLSAAVTVNIRYVEAFAESESSSWSEDPLSSLILQDAYTETLSWLEGVYLKELAKKGKIQREQIQFFLRAVTSYLLDLMYSAGHDSCAEYFRQSFPKGEHGKYRDQYRYVFEMVMKAAMREFGKRLN